MNGAGGRNAIGVGGRNTVGVAGDLRIPTGFCPLAQGCRAAATLGIGINSTYPEGVVSHGRNQSHT